MPRKTSCLLLSVLLCGGLSGRFSRADGPPFIAHLPRGTVELVGVTTDYRPSKQSRWWRPDGGAAAISPVRAVQNYGRSPVRFADEMIRTFLVRFADVPPDVTVHPVGGVSSLTTPPPGARRNSKNWVAGEGTSAKYSTEFFTGAPQWNAGTHLWEVTAVWDGVDGRGVPTPPSEAHPSQPAPKDRAGTYAERDAIPDHYSMFAAVLATSAATTDLRIGVSMGEWQTVISWKPDSGGTSSFNRDEREWTVTFSRAKTVHSATEVALKSTYTYGQWNKRLVAVDSDGNEHATSIGNGGDNGVAKFPNLPLSSIKEFRMQVRPFDRCVEFDNISLRPGQETHVIVISCDDSGNTKK
jgi:hypothetical protein